MLSTMGMVSGAATLVLGVRAATGWTAYHEAKIPRSALITRVMLTLSGAGTTAGLFLAAKLTGL